MGNMDINRLDSYNKKSFMLNLINDIEALDIMLKEGMIEKGKSRVGAEQEFCLIGPDCRPSNLGTDILESINEKHFTTELAKWNLEINLDPFDIKSGCFNAMENQLQELLKLAHKKAAEYDNRLILTGILPTIQKSHLDFKYMTPIPRYEILNSSFKEMRGKNFSLFIEGVDEISLKHDSILFEACNTSFQIHLQVSPEDIADQYNWAQAIAGPVLAACVNSPILLGKELWNETRIALFSKSIDIRNPSNYIRDRQPRVAFGYDWIKESVTEVYKQDVSQYKLMIGTEKGVDSLDELRKGRIPNLDAINVHNGTIYKWNRLCYGVGGGIPHIRIENRYIPAGPTAIDEMANTAFWIGLMLGMPEDLKGKFPSLPYQDVRNNFLKAARHGIEVELNWMGESINATDLIINKLIPLAENGLRKKGLEKSEIDKYLGIIHDRVKLQKTGAKWITNSMRKLNREHTRDECMLLITKQMHENNMTGAPGHTWKLATDKSLHTIPDKYKKVSQVMDTTTLSVMDSDVLYFALKVMEWNNIEYIAVETTGEIVVGMISIEVIKEAQKEHKGWKLGIVKDFMLSDIITLGPEMSLEKAQDVLKINKVKCIPVVSDNLLVGVIRDSDIRSLKS